MPRECPRCGGLVGPKPAGTWKTPGHKVGCSSYGIASDHAWFDNPPQGVGDAQVHVEALA